MNVLLDRAGEAPAAEMLAPGGGGVVSSARVRCKTVACSLLGAACPVRVIPVISRDNVPL